MIFDEIHDLEFQLKIADSWLIEKTQKKISLVMPLKYFCGITTEILIFCVITSLYIKGRQF